MAIPAILITGANGEIGHGLINKLKNITSLSIVTLDLNNLDDKNSQIISEKITGDILDLKILDRINKKYEIKQIFHLAAILSSQAEKNPIRAHNVNVNGTINLLNLAFQQGIMNNYSVKFFFPSSIAVYGFTSLTEKNNAHRINEKEYLNPLTIYGCNKLYCEHIGRYFSKRYKNNSEKCNYIDFRSIRFPGIISSKTQPTGGTSDYIPEMLHSCAIGKPYKCFVSPNAQIPFMTMVDAINAILKLMNENSKNLGQTSYNVRAFSPTAEDFRKKMLELFPNSKIVYEINNKKQNMVNTWPKDINDQAAKNDWGWEPIHNLDRALLDYLIPDLKKIYKILGD